MRRTVAFSRDATNLFFHILTACNLRCAHCYINLEAHGGETVPLPTIRNWLTAFTDGRNPENANVIFLGGEPTLHPDLPEAIRAARSLGYGSVTVDTNGYLFHDILSKVAPEEVDYFSFSLDGATPGTNDALRGNGCFATCTEGIRRAVALGFRTSLIYTVSRSNIVELAAMPELLAELGVERFFIQVIGLRGESAGKGRTAQLTHKEWAAAVPPVARAAADRGITVTYPKVFLEPGEPFECAGLVADNYFIFPNGRIYRCPLCEDYPLNSLRFEGDVPAPTPRLNEADLFPLRIPEGCVMNKLIQPDNITYTPDGRPTHRVACCMLKEEVAP